MSEATAVASGKKKAEVTLVKMQDGREAAFAGKRKVNKDTLIDESKIVVDGDTITLAAGAISTRMDFLNGETRTYAMPIGLIPRFCGHGAEQKRGDELAYTSKPGDPPVTLEDLVQWSDELDERIQGGDWNAVREAGEGGVAGAHVVVQAIVEAMAGSSKPKSIQEVKDWLKAKLETAKAAGQKLSRKELYDSFRNPDTKVGKIVKRIEDEALKTSSKVDADAELAEMQNA